MNFLAYVVQKMSFCILLKNGLIEDFISLFPLCRAAATQLDRPSGGVRLDIQPRRDVRAGGLAGVGRYRRLLRGGQEALLSVHLVLVRLPQGHLGAVVPGDQEEISHIAIH